MSAGGAFGGSRGLQPLPPEKGVFPLDHFGECKQIRTAFNELFPHSQTLLRSTRTVRMLYDVLRDLIMTEYMKCLKENGNKGEKCRDISKSYLECRMDRNLMAKQELRELGFSETNESSAASPIEAPKPTSVPESKKSRTGYVAGLPSNNPAK